VNDDYVCPPPIKSYKVKIKLKQNYEDVMKKKEATKPSSKTATSTATKTATATKTSTDAYTQGNITVTGGAGKGATSVNIKIPGLASGSQKKAKGKK